MMISRVCIVFLVSIMTCSFSIGQTLSTKKIEKVLKNFDQKFLLNDSGQYEFYHGDVKLLCIVNKETNLIRVMSPIESVKNLSGKDIQKSMEANHSSPRNVQYSIYNNILWSTFISPLDEVNKVIMIDGINRVYANNRSFGTTYSSDYFAYNDQENNNEIEIIKE